MSKLTKALTAAAGNAGAGALYVEDVFSTYLYDGNGSTQTITNGIDLAGEGGMVWTKERSPTGRNHFIGDSERDNFARYVYPDLTSQQTPVTNPAYDITSVSSTGYSLGPNNYTWNNESGSDQVSWTFRKAEKFFDIQTYTGNGTAGRTIAHNLGSVPAVIIVKKTDGTAEWPVYHKDESSYGTTGQYEGRLNETSDFGWDYISGTPTDAVFAVTGDTAVNGSGSTYVAYLFASDAGGFGDDGSENIIKCGSYTGNGGAFDLNLGFEPQWLLVKSTSNTGPWLLTDSMRGLASPASTTVSNRILLANAANAEGSDGLMYPTATGLQTKYGNTFNESGKTYIYIAIRRPMKTPEAGTEVFAPISLGTTTEPGFVSGFVTDFTLHNTVDETGSTQISSRLTGNEYMLADSTGTGGSISAVQWDFMNGSRVGNGTANSDEIQWMFKRATGFMDVVCYSGNGTIGATQAHNLGVVPEMMIVKNRSSGADNWPVYHKDAGTGYLFLNASDAYRSTQYAWNNTNPSASTFTLHSNSQVNGTGFNYINYLFATLAGVSKVGSYTGTGSNLNVDCGFSAGARFILIKRTDSTGDWYVWDSLRGIVAGNDPYFFLNNTAAQVTNTDYIDPLSSGFTVTSNASSTVNVSSGTYIFLAIA